MSINQKSITDWIEYLDEMNSIFLPNITFSTGDSDMHMFFISMEQNLNKITFEDFAEFLDNPKHHYIFETTSKTTKLHQEYVLLAYFLSYKFSVNMVHKWALDINILDLIYCDFGIDFPASYEPKRQAS